MIRLFSLLLAAIAGISAVFAEQTMCVITDTGRNIDIRQVECIVASDDEPLMSLLLSDGLTLSGIAYVTFGYAEGSGIILPEDPCRSVTYVGRNIVISGAPAGAAVSVGDLSGRTIVSVTADASPCVIDASSLASNECYIVTVNGVSTKIIKR